MSNLEQDFKEMERALACTPDQIEKQLKDSETLKYAKQIAPYVKVLTEIYGQHNFDIERKKKWDLEVS